ncbi:MAG: 3-deoxy-D-manno-octulosonic acid transferase [candidate division NC10 bacterium]|nr:3-deoxy-D-manno-octulosonic acid transferase [candidate division NC10 bacterium]
MYGLYTVGLLVAFLAMTPRLLWRYGRGGAFRAGIGQRRGRYGPGDLAGLRGMRPVWLHAVSVGEVLAVSGLVRALRERRPDIPVLVSTVTETGQAVAVERLGEAHSRIYFPFDLPGCVRRALEAIRPRLVLLAETEIWPNFLRACGERAIPVVLVNGRISPRSFPRYRLARPFLRRVVQDITLYLMQGEADAERLRALGAPAERIRVMGNLKYDLRVAPVSAAERRAWRASVGIPGEASVLVAGSTHGGEEEGALAALSRLRELAPDARLILAPRHPERFQEAEAAAAAAGLACGRWSARPFPSGFQPPVILVDTVGELGRLYALGTVVFVGGSLTPVGGHNILEPAQHACPILFGPHMANFAEMAEAFLAEGAALQVQDGAGLTAAVVALVRDPAAAKRLGEAAAVLLERHRGATARAVAALEALL